MYYAFNIKGLSFEELVELADNLRIDTVMPVGAPNSPARIEQEHNKTLYKLVLRELKNRKGNV